MPATDGGSHRAALGPVVRSNPSTPNHTSALPANRGQVHQKNDTNQELDDGLPNIRASSCCSQVLPRLDIHNHPVKKLQNERDVAWIRVSGAVSVDFYFAASAASSCSLRYGTDENSPKCIYRNRRLNNRFVSMNLWHIPAPKWGCQALAGLGQP